MSPVMQMPPMGNPAEAKRMLKEANRLYFALEAMKIILPGIVAKDCGIHASSLADASVKIADEMVKRLYPD
jgi:hypothetical protein